MAGSGEIEANKSMPRSKRIFGHPQERNFLQMRLADGQMHHALLFEGEQGIGKATLAFHYVYHILADKTGREPSEVFWKNPETQDFLWNKMEQGAHPGLLYIERGKDIKTGRTKTAITVDDIRRVSQFLQKTSADRGWRIVIIDAADDMNRNAANALLKTLEEPPSKTLFILISHNAGKLLPTIRSRCQWLRFKPLPDDIMAKILPHIVSAYELKNNDERNKKIISLSDGSVYRALTLLLAGGVDAVDSMQEIIVNPIFLAPIAQKLAESLNKKDNTDFYIMFLNQALDFIQKKAIQAAKEHQLILANRWADFFILQEKEISQAQSYNLDKKQFILTFLQKMHIFYQHNKLDKK